ncbi:hypothetical protein O181_058130 [Austropuccinia psidii MF-1]|uniref:Uncharacterized protein n=1 Tax=Austropuccinia psidii MF-1 TaxID=1389203 RepID=A0A9Q3E933_9BASI|nr:hypothetical protein [Austropuccinia psidii MF-1]
MNPFPPLRIFLHLSITLLPAWIQTNFSDVLELLDYCSTDLCSELSGLDPLPYPSPPQAYCPLLRETKTIPSDLPFQPNPNLRINEKDISKFQQKTPSNYQYESSFNYEHSRNTQLSSQRSWSPHLQSQTHILQPTLVETSHDRNHIVQSSNNRGQEIFKSADSFEKIPQKVSKGHSHFLTSNAQATLGNFPFDSELEHGGKPNTWSEFRRGNVLIMPLEDRNEMDMARNSPRKKLSALNDENRITHQVSNESLKQILASEFYELIQEANSKDLDKKLASFVKTIQHKISPQDPKIFWQRLFFIIKLSLARSKHYALLYQNFNAKDREGLIKIQMQTFEFLKFFWSLALTHEEDCNSKYHDIGKSILTTAYMRKSKASFESLSRDHASGEWASWYGMQAFVNIHWEATLDKLQKRRINHNVRYFERVNQENVNEEKHMQEDTFNLHQISKNAPNNLLYSLTKSKGEAVLHKFELSLNNFLQSIAKRNDENQIFKGISTSAIKTRVSYAFIASFLHIHIYGSLGLPIKLRKDCLIDFEKKAFCLQEYFWEVVLFQKAEFPSNYITLKPNLTKSVAVQNCRKTIGQKGTSEQKAESASWNASNFFISWFWNEILTRDSKSQIRNNILSQETQVGTKKTIKGSYEIDLVEDVDHPNLYCKPRKANSKLDYNCTRELGRIALKNYENRLKEFLELILVQYKQLRQEFKHKDPKV